MLFRSRLVGRPDTVVRHLIGDAGFQIAGETQVLRHLGADREVLVGGNRHGREDADDGDHDQQLDEREPRCECLRASCASLGPPVAVVTRVFDDYPCWAGPRRSLWIQSGNGRTSLN